jgi:hypothetical protein
MTYARDTSVPVSRSQEEIKKTLQKYGATGFVFGEADGQALVIFEMKARRIKFLLPIPQERTKEKTAQKERTRWRCLLLAIKAKLESVESGIALFENEFLANIVMPNGETVGQNILPKIAEAYQTKQMPALLGPGVGA